MQSAEFKSGEQTAYRNVVALLREKSEKHHAKAIRCTKGTWHHNLKAGIYRALAEDIELRFLGVEAPEAVNA